MDYLTYAKRLRYTLELIKKGTLHSPNQLARKFDCSEKTVRRMINELRSEGYNIKYSRKYIKYILII